MKDWRLEQIKQIRTYGLRAEPTALLLAIDDLLAEVATHEPASPVAQPENDSLEATHTDASTTFSSVAQPCAGGEPRGITDTYEEGDENPNNIRFTYPPPSPSMQATSSKEIWAIVGMIHKIKGISDGAERKRWYDEIAGILASPSGQAAARCGCVCHKVGLFGLMCCPCTKKALDELVNGKPSIPISPTGGAEPPQHHIWCNYWTGNADDCKHCAHLREKYPYSSPEEMAALVAKHFPEVSQVPPPPAAAEPSAGQWPSDLPANGMGAMNLLTNFWTGDLKGLTKEGARIVDSLVAHVNKGMRANLSQKEAEYEQLRVAFYRMADKKDSDAAGLREQLEQVSIKTRNPKE